MKLNKYNIRGTEMNKMQFSEIEFYLEEKGLNVNNVFNQIADENEFIYVSNGFVRGLITNENEAGEWHHYFQKDIDGVFVAGKLKFN
jgi:hypothetical protein